MSDLQMTFTGLCAFVPNTATSPNQQARVLMVGGGLDCWKSAEDIHVPVLLVQMNQYQGKTSTKEPDLLFKGQVHPQFGQKVWVGLFFLKDLELEIVGAQPNSLNIVDGPLDRECPTNPDSTRFSWVASLAEIMPAHGSINDACLGLNPPASVSARVRLWEGKLSTLRFASSSYRRKWKFGEDGGPLNPIPNRAIADVVNLSASTVNSEVSISLAPLRGEASSSEICLCSSNSADVNVSVRNLPLLDILGLRKGKTLVDRHFDNHYRLSSNDPGQWKGHVPHRGEKCPDGILVRTPSCPLARFQPHQNA